MTSPVALSAAEEPRGNVATADPSVGPFVVNLCSSTTPMALAQPQDPALKRFKFFVSRRLEDGRERFRLHMGYFETLEEAQEWVVVAREFYPGAWAGEAPGKKLGQHGRSRDPAPSARATSAPVAAAEPSSGPLMTSAEAQAPPPASNIPVLRAVPDATPPAAAAPLETNSAPEPVLELVEDDVPASVAKPAQSVSTSAQAPKAREAQTQARPAAAVREPARATKSNGVAGRRSGKSNVREVIASLGDAQPTRAIPRAKSATEPHGEKTLSDSQVLQVLEHRRSDGKSGEPDTTIALLKPDDTATRRALARAVTKNEPVYFAVQLNWSVQPIDVSALPPLAIFGAYTLYTVEGSREGRRWYGLRLGFFSDATSAKQVAHYVRSEFNSVSVIPVSPQERSRAKGSDGGANAGQSNSVTAKPQAAGSRRTAPPVAPALAPGASPTRPRSPVRDKLPEPSSEFKLFDDEPPLPRISAPAAAKPRHASSTERGHARSSANRVRAGERRSPQTLEETLEILGADQLEIEPRRERTLGGTARATKPQPRRDSPFAKFLDRLSEKAQRHR